MAWHIPPTVLGLLVVGNQHKKAITVVVELTNFIYVRHNKLYSSMYTGVSEKYKVNSININSDLKQSYTSYF